MHSGHLQYLYKHVNRSTQWGGKKIENLKYIIMCDIWMWVIVKFSTKEIFLFNVFQEQKLSRLHCSVQLHKKNANFKLQLVFFVQYLLHRCVAVSTVDRINMPAYQSSVVGGCCEYYGCRLLSLIFLLNVYLWHTKGSSFSQRIVQ